MSSVKLNMAYATIRTMESQLAALREELAMANDSYKAAIAGKQEFIDKCNALQQRLADAERRNAELVELLRDVKLYGTASYCYGGPSVSDRINAALKPTESGASE